MIKHVAIAGATGYTGKKVVIEVGHQPIWDPRALVRPGSADKVPQVSGLDTHVLALDDIQALTNALRGCSAVIQTIGTTKAQFKPGVNYETVDYGTTIALIHAALIANVPRFILLSSAGAGHPIGSYLKWKKHTEDAVRNSTLNWTILRPAAIVGRGRVIVGLVSRPFTLLGNIPYLGKPFQTLQPMNVNTLAETLVACLDDPLTYNRILEGSSLWSTIKRQRHH